MIKCPSAVPDEDGQQELLVISVQSEAMVQEAVEHASEGAGTQAQCGGREDEILGDVARFGDQHSVTPLPVLPLVARKETGQANHRGRTGYHLSLDRKSVV